MLQLDIELGQPGELGGWVKCVWQITHHIICRCIAHTNLSTHTNLQTESAAVELVKQLPLHLLLAPTTPAAAALLASPTALRMHDVGAGVCSKTPSRCRPARRWCKCLKGMKNVAPQQQHQTYKGMGRTYHFSLTRFHSLSLPLFGRFNADYDRCFGHWSGWCERAVAFDFFLCPTLIIRNLYSNLQIVSKMELILCR